MDAAELVGPVDEPVDGVVPDGDGGPGLSGRGVVAPVAVVHVNHDVGEVGRVEADLADVVPLGQQQHGGELVPARRLVGQQDARVAGAPVAAAAGDEAEVRAGVVLAGVGGGAAEIGVFLEPVLKNGGKNSNLVPLPPSGSCRLGSKTFMSIGSSLEPRSRIL